MQLGSLFDGIGAFPLSASKHGIKAVWASEIEPFPIKVTSLRFPDMKHIGDVTKINGAEIEPVDIITFGSPCTRLSVAGKHDGFDINFECQGNKDSPHETYSKTIRATDKYQYEYTTTCPVCGQVLFETNESALFFHAIRVIREMRDATNGTYPRFAVWENVPGAFSSNKGEDFRAVLEEIAETEIPMPRSGKWANAGMVRTKRADIAWRVLDAQYWGVPQRRKRIFLVADFRGRCASEILFVEQGLRGNLAESGEAGQEAAATAGDGVEGTIFAIAFGGAREQNVSSPLMANEGPNRHQGFSNTQFDAVCIRMREGSDGGGKGPLISEDKSLTLGCSNYQTLGPAGDECYNLVIEPRSQDGVCRIHHDVVPTLNTAQGGQRQPCVMACPDIAHCVWSQPSKADKPDSTTYVIQNATRVKSQNGLGISQDDVSYTLDSLGNHAVATIDCRNLYENEEVSGTLQHGYSLNYQNPVRIGYAVRRLTPLECERLMGFPDGWTDIPGASDTARYKALGNSIAVPCLDYIFENMSELLKEGTK